MFKLLLALSTLFIAVQAAVKEPAPNPIGCIALFDPVCCNKRGGFSTASNSCVCKRDGGKVVSDSFCKRPPLCRCPKILRPVCCKRRWGASFTAPNSCICRCRGGRVLHTGKCKKPTPTPTTRPTPCICTLEIFPVCCLLRNGKTITTNNPCLCTNCERGRVISHGKCPTPKPTQSPSPRPTPCICTKELFPVCCRLPNGRKITTLNPCLCTKCESGRVIFKRKCPTVKPTPSPSPSPPPKPCICTRELRPVCCCLRNGKTITTNNPCLCKKCSRGRVISEGRCPKDCVCPAVFNPVCCRRGLSRKTEGNACQCTCDGGRVESTGACPPAPGACICPAVYEPVCCDIKGVLRKESNSCTCGCAGGEVVSKGKCLAE